MAEGTRFDLKEEFAGPDFHSVRPEERFVRTMETLIQQPGGWKVRRGARRIYPAGSK
jgi:hypothetical protein